MKKLLPVVFALIATGTFAQRITFRRFADNPIIRPEQLPGTDGENINGPSLIRAPDWLPGKLGKYYLYFAHHNGQYIRLAYADDLKGPWKIHEPGTLRLDECACKGEPGDLLGKSKHIASPDVFVDEANRQLVMYFHCPIYASGDKGKKASYAQLTLRGTSGDGLRFRADTTRLGESYFRVFEWKGAFYALSRLGVLRRSPDGIARFEKGHNPFDKIQHPSTLRHAALYRKGDRLWVFYSRIGDTPEQIYASVIPLTGDWTTWTPSPPQPVALPEKDYEGADLPLAASKEGLSLQRVRQLRDPYVFGENGKLYLLYSVAGEKGIAIGELTID